MVEDGEAMSSDEVLSVEERLSQAQELVPQALEKARGVKSFAGRWKTIITRLEQMPSRLSDLSSHPCFSKNSLCKEQLQAVSETLKETIELADLCVEEKFKGKLRMQSDLDTLVGKMDLNLRDCMLLIKSGVLGDISFPSPATSSTSVEQGSAFHGNVKELLARLQIGHLDAKDKALDSLVEAMKDDEQSVLSVIGRSNVAALIQLLTSTSLRIREKAIALICVLAESETCENWLLSEGVLPPVIKLVESGSAVGREKAAISLHRLSTSAEAARAMAGYGAARPLIEICETGDSVLQGVAACTLKNMSAVPEARQTLSEEGIVKAMIDVLDRGAQHGSKEYAAECLQNLTSSNEELRASVVAGGGVRSLLAYLDSSLPRESAVRAIRNLVASVPTDYLLSLALLPRLVRVLSSGSVGAQQEAASTICRICSSNEMKRAIGEEGCIPLLVKMLEAKGNGAREVAAQAISSLISLSHNSKMVKRDGKSIPNLVALLDPSPHNTAKKYAVSCLVMLSSSKRCKKLMISYGAIGYLKKLAETDISGTKKLLARLERGKLKSLFSRK